ncbi:Hypothetical_protein [Hexamita inflata]|uniref:Hypothetical_protein n=1 Tax=Hexamita inflata TaxID=28002 RepID=A0ABP1HSC0_9EUKA
MYNKRTSAVKATSDSGTSIQGRNAAASYKPIYSGILVVTSAFLSNGVVAVSQSWRLFESCSALCVCPQIQFFVNIILANLVNANINRQSSVNVTWMLTRSPRRLTPCLKTEDLINFPWIRGLIPLFRKDQWIA